MPQPLAKRHSFLVAKALLRGKLGCFPLGPGSPGVVRTATLLAVFMCTQDSWRDKDETLQQGRVS